MPWTLARRAARLEPSTIREILKVTERPGIISLAGGLPSADGFPVRRDGRGLRQGAARQPARGAAVRRQRRLRPAARVGRRPSWRTQGMAVQARPGADHHRVAAGAGPGRQGADRPGQHGGGGVAHLPGRAAGLQRPTRPSSCRSTATTRARCRRRWTRRAARASSTCCPTSRTRAGAASRGPPAGDLAAARRRTRPADGRGQPLRRPVVRRAAAAAAVGALAGDAAVYLGSFSKVLAPGLRLGYVVAPKALYPKLLQAKQAADLHTPGFNQRIVHEVIKRRLPRPHVPTIRARYKAQRDAMRDALERHLPRGCRWSVPVGGMFFWVELPPASMRRRCCRRRSTPAWPTCPGLRSMPTRRRQHLRLSFVTVPPERIDARRGGAGRVCCSQPR
jgi:2-aminoadipate transaminase